jgi:hypothetical protein
MGKAKDFLSLVQSGVIDIAYVAPGFVSDKMPLSVVSELPLEFSGSCQGTMAYWNLAKPGGLLDKKEFAPNGVRLLFTIVLPPYQIITEEAVLEPEGDRGHEDPRLGVGEGAGAEEAEGDSPC